MKWRALLLASVVWLVSMILTFAASIAVITFVGHQTSSGLVGVCGPYGPKAGLLVWMFLASIPISAAMGLLAAYVFYSSR